MIRMREDTKLNVSRRRYLGAVGAITAGVIAGCMGEDGSPVDHESGGDANRFNYMRGGVHFPDLQWNPEADQYNSTIANWVDEPTLIVRSADNALDAWGLTNWEYNPDERRLTLELRDDLVFWNGDPYTAEDFYAYQEMLRLVNPDGSQYEEITHVDERTIEFVTKESMNPEIAYRSAVPVTLVSSGGTDVWTEWVERYQNAANTEERDAITEELIAYRIENKELMENGWGIGAYEMVDVTDEYIDWVAHEEHPFWGPAAEEKWDREPNIEEIRLWYAEETGRREQFIVDERVDIAGHGHNWKTFKGQLPDYWEQIIYYPQPDFRKMNINWRNRAYLQDVNFRRAMAAAIDFENNATNVSEYTVESHSGMSVAFNEEYWGEHPPGNLIDYGVTTDEKLAEQYLERAGITREEGTMYGEDGEELAEMRFVLGSSPWSDIGQSVAGQLEQFGFPIDVQPIGRDAKLETVLEEMEAWDLTTETHYVSGIMHPSAYFNPESFWGWRIGPGNFEAEPEWGDLVNGWLEEGRTHSPFNGKPMVFEIPEEVGAETRDGSTKEINLVEHYNEVTSPIEEERDRELIRDFSWAWNFLLPDIDLTVTVEDAFGNTEKMAYGEEKELTSYHAMFRPINGLMRLRE